MWSRGFPLLIACALLLGSCGDDDAGGQAAGDAEAAENEAGASGLFGVAVVDDGARAADVELVEDLLSMVLDRTSDGQPDSAAVAEELERSGARIIIGTGEEFAFEHDERAATLRLSAPGVVDELTALQPVHALLYRYGWAEVFDEDFGARRGSELAFGMDRARGGSFDSPPDAYPDDAWFTDSTPSCDYECQLTRYFFHVHMTLTGRYEDSAVCQSLANVWGICSLEALAARDPVGDRLLRSPQAGLASPTS